METKTTKPPAKPKLVKAQRKKTIAMLQRLGLTDADFEWRTGSSCVDDAILNRQVRIQVLHCNNATQVNRTYNIRTVTPFALLGSDVVNRSMFEIDTHGLDFRIL